MVLEPPAAAVPPPDLEEKIKKRPEAEKDDVKQKKVEEKGEDRSIAEKKLKIKEDKVGDKKNVKKPETEREEDDSEKAVKKNVDKVEEKKEAEEQKFAILPPHEASGPGENGKPYKVDKEKAEPEIKERIERGWKNNAYNEYVSDLISVHR